MIKDYLTDKSGLMEGHFVNFKGLNWGNNPLSFDSSNEGGIYCLLNSKK
jgi:hypothetical protein